MKQRLVYAVLATFAIAAPAAAEPQHLAQNFAADALPAYEIMTIVRSAGLDPLGPPVRRGANYVLHAIGGDDREVRVLVDSRSGGILSITPMRTASPASPRGGVTLGPYERMPPGYIPAEPLGIYRAGPPVEYEDDEPPVAYGTRPPAPVPGGAPLSRNAAPPRVITATPNGDDIASSEESTVEPRSGMLPPPPERFPQRVAPVTSAKPKPVKRAAAAVPKQAPLPKPRPPSAAGASPPLGSVDAAPVPPLVPETKPAAPPLPN